MDTPTDKNDPIEQYIRAYPEPVQKRLQTIRRTIRAEAKEAVETLSYGVPTFKLHGKNLVSFGAAKSHIGFYPTPSGVAAVQAELTGYTFAKGSIQFPLDKPLPVTLIRKIVKFRVQEENKKRAAKGRAG